MTIVEQAAYDQNSKNLKSKNRMDVDENDLDESNLIGKLYKKCIIPLIRIGKPNNIKFADLERIEAARRYEESLYYQNRKRINSISEGSEKLVPRHSIANKKYYFEPKNRIKSYFGVSMGSPNASHNRKGMNVRETKSQA
jgi:hypothetical protein